MTLTGRVPLLVLLGLAALVLRPAASTAVWWLVAVAALVTVDLLLAARPDSLTVTRRSTGQIRLGETTSTDLLVANAGARRVRGVLRDAW